MSNEEFRGGVTDEEVKAMMETAATIQTGDFNRFELQVGQYGSAARNVFRLVPRHPSQKRTWVYSRMHFGLGPTKDKQTSGPCLGMFDKPCPIETRAGQIENEMKSETNERRVAQMEEVVKNLKAKDRFGALVWDPSRPAGPLKELWVSADLYKKLVPLFLDDQKRPRVGDNDITHPKFGRNIILDIQRQGPKSDYWDYPTIKLADEKTEIPNWEELHKQVYNIEELNVWEPTEEQLMDALLQGKKVPRPTRAMLRSAASGSGSESSGSSDSGDISDILRGRGADGAKPVGASSTAAAEAPPSSGRGRGRRTAEVTPATSGGSTTSTPATGTAATGTATVTRRALKDDDEEPPADSSDPYAAGRAWLKDHNFLNPKEITPEDLEARRVAGKLEPIEGCFGVGLDPNDSICVTCRAPLPCATMIATNGRAGIKIKK